MHIPVLKPAPGARRSIRRAHTVDGMWAALLLDAEFTVAPLLATVRDTRFTAEARHLAVQCRRHVASVRRAFAADWPPYHVAAGKVPHR